MANKVNRTSRAIKNVGINLLSEIVSLVCGLILPRLILNNYGSAYNGITQSITQFISYIALMKAGIAGAASAALYKPLADKDTKEISVVLASMQKFMRKISAIFVAFVLVFAIIYPTFIVTDYGWMFTASLIVIISISTFAQYYFGITYQTLICTDQKAYIITILDIVTVILNTIVAVILMNNNCSIHIVKLGSSLVNIISPIFLYFYVRNKYNVSYEKPDDSKLTQKWDAAAHEVAAFVNHNTDLVILTAFTNVLEVSVYTVYHYVISNIKKVVTNSTTSFGAAFGDMYAREEYELMKENLGIFELITFSMVSIIYSTTLVMIVPFALLYTKGVNDVNYSRPLFSIVLIIANAFNCFRIPYRTITISVGHYKQTRNGAIMEAVINIVVSIICTIKFGVIGVAIGTLCAMSIRSYQFAKYLSDNIINRSINYYFKHVFICFAIMAIVFGISRFYIQPVYTWMGWIIYSTITTLISMALTITTDLLVYKKDVFNFIIKLKNVIYRTKNK